MTVESPVGGGRLSVLTGSVFAVRTRRTAGALLCRCRCLLVLVWLWDRCWRSLSAVCCLLLAVSCWALVLVRRLLGRGPFWSVALRRLLCVCFVGCLRGLSLVFLWVACGVSWRVTGSFFRFPVFLFTVAWLVAVSYGAGRGRPVSWCGGVLFCERTTWSR